MKTQAKQVCAHAPKCRTARTPLAPVILASIIAGMWIGYFFSCVNW